MHNFQSYSGIYFRAIAVYISNFLNYLCEIINLICLFFCTPHLPLPTLARVDILRQKEIVRGSRVKNCTSIMSFYAHFSLFHMNHWQCTSAYPHRPECLNIPLIVEE